ncbi:MAG: efflux RND transporter periplasmic adaptor subunit [Paludibacteraceae bacterium]|nr:efflux RND transporter periplasmic adaptor subunit [Paludibacteraceae bacterium]
MKKISLFVVSALALVACGNKQAGDSNQEVPELKVVTTEMKLCQVPLQVPCQLRGKQDIAIIPQVSGTLSEVLVIEGQKVEKGQAMFKIDPTAYQAAMENAQAAVLRAEAAVKTQELEVESKKVLLDKNIISEHEYKVQENSLMMARANLAEAKAALKNAKNDLGHSTIYSPHTGVVGTISFKQGSLVGPEMGQPITIVSDNSTIYAYASIAERSYMNLMNEYGCKDSIIANLPELQLLLGEDFMYEHKGHLETISGIIDPTTGAISVRVAFPNPDGKLVAGGSGRIEAIFEYESLTIPRNATFDIQDKTFCYLAVPQDSTFVAEQKEIMVYRLNETEYLVEGLNEGDKVITEGVKRIVNGQEIKPCN